MRRNKATVRDSGLGDSFIRGVNEGFRLTGYVTVFCRVGANVTRKEMEASEVYRYVGEFLAGLRGEHYEVGVEIKVLANGDVTTKAATTHQPELEEAVVEAEIVPDDEG